MFNRLGIVGVILCVVFHWAAMPVEVWAQVKESITIGRVEGPDDPGLPPVVYEYGPDPPEYIPPESLPPEGPPWLPILIRVHPVNHCLGGEGCLPDDRPRVRVELLGCDGQVIASQTQAVDYPPCGVENLPVVDDVGVELYFVFVPCGDLPTGFRVIPIDSMRGSPGSGGDPCGQSWQEGTPVGPGSIEPPPLDGTLDRTALDCLSAEPKERPTRGRVTLYKESPRILYTRPSRDAGQSWWGETVNGRFYMPGRRLGQLFVEEKGVVEAVDVLGAAQVNAAARAWQTAGGRAGVRLMTVHPRFLAVTSSTPGDFVEYTFNVRTHRGSAPDFDVRFHWYHYEQDGSGQACRLVHEVEGLGAEVKPLPCEFTGREPVMPELRRGSGLDGHLEVRLPCCASCEANQAICPPGDLSGWSVVWPTGFEGLIEGGHAMGWRVVESGSGPLTWVLRSPEVGGFDYEFAVNP